MLPQATPPRPAAIIDYYDASRDRRRMAERLLRSLSGLLAVSAAASAVIPWWNVWGFDFVSGLAVVTAIGLALRAWGPRPLVPLRSAWALGVAVFGYWTVVLLSNQFHGRPPRSDLYLIFGWAMSCAMSVLGLLFESRRSAAA